MLKRFSLLLLLLTIGWAAPASAQTAAGAAGASATGPSRLQAEQALEILQDPKKREQLIETLQAIAKAAPPASEPAKPAGTAAPALAPNSLAAQVLVQMSHWADRLGAETAATVKSITDLPRFWGWLGGIINNPAESMTLVDAAWRLLLIVACGLLGEFLAGRALRRPAVALEGHAPGAATEQPQTANTPPNPADIMPPPPLPAMRPAPGNGAGKLLRRLPFALVRLLFELAPVAVFATIGDFLAGPLAPSVAARLVALALVNAYAIDRLVLCFGRMLVSPHRPRLRLLPVGDAGADYLMRWLKAIAGIAVFGSVLAEIALGLGVDETMHDTLVRLVALIVALLLIMMVIDSRQAVARAIRPREGADDAFGRWRSWLAQAWQYLAIVAIALGWLAWSAGVRNGVGGLRYLIGTAAVLAVARVAAIVALGSLDRVTRLGRAGDPDGGTGGHRAPYYRTARAVIIAAVAVLTALMLLQVWGIDALDWFRADRVGRRVLSALVTIAIAAICALLVWEAANAAINRRLARLAAASSASRVARLRTLLPILRASLLSAIVAVVGLTALSEIGINIAPLLAGAGIAGVAVGFGSQKLVQDVITGVFVLIENAIQVGDSVTVAGLSGTVEQLSVRNIWLRAGEGAVHVIPFSAVTTITNSSRGLGNAAITVTVAYQEDIDRVTGVLSEIVAEMRREPAYAALIVSDLKVLGVDAVKASGVTIVGQIVCTDSGRLPVQREFNRRLQRRFQELGIELAA